MEKRKKMGFSLLAWGTEFFSEETKAGKKKKVLRNTEKKGGQGKGKHQM